MERVDMVKAMQMVIRATGKSAIRPVLSNVLISAARDPLWDVLGDAGDGDGIYVLTLTATSGMKAPKSL